MGFCVKNNKSQYMEGLSYPTARGIGLARRGRLEGQNYGFAVAASKLLNNSITFVFYLFKSVPFYATNVAILGRTSSDNFWFFF